MSDKKRYSDEELAEFRALINKKLEKAEADFELLRSSFDSNKNNDVQDTSPTFKIFDEGAYLLTKEETGKLAERQEKFIKHLKDALLRIDNKTYGLCRKTGKLISKERLMAVPHATLSIDAKNAEASMKK